jgi:S-DNA-T family DNA segregation ATPase FtsK/SpoIIIE
MAYKVRSAVDSKVILDTKGAEKLIGKGDMLYCKGMDPVRLQTPYISTAEVERLVDFISNQQGYDTPYFLPEPPVKQDDDDDMAEDMGERDKLFEEAARLVVKTQQGSTSLLQRKMNIGYNRAGRVMDQLEMARVVGPSRGSKPRDVLIGDLEELERYL